MIEYTCKSVKTQNSFLNSGTTRINYSNYWTSCSYCMIHYLRNFFCTHLAECSTKNRKVICKKKDLSSRYCSVSCHYTISRKFFVLHVKLIVMVSYKCINLSETSFIK